MNNFESFLHIETNKVDKLRAVAIEYNVEEIHCEECLAEYIRERRSKESNFFAMTIPAFTSIEKLKVIEKKLFN